MRHRLAAVWFADIAGFSVDAEPGEAEALSLVQRFHALCREIVERYGGRVAHVIGDATLAEFSSTHAAVCSAQALTSASPRALRIGIHVGEVASGADGALYGDGINIAAHLRAAAVPGQIIVSEDVWRQLRRRREFSFTPLGARALGELDSVAIYAVEVQGDAPPEARRSPLGSLAGLRRRRVFRVAAVYAVSAWAAVQVANSTFAPLHLPGWALTAVVVAALAGFPIAVALAWIFERAPEAGKEARTRSWLRRGVVAGLGLAGLGLVAWGAWQRLAPDPPPISRTAVAVLPFTVRGDEAYAYLGAGMVTLLGTKLDDAATLRSVDPHALLQHVGDDSAAPFDIERGSAVARRFGAALYVLGNVVVLGERLHLDATLYDTARPGIPLTKVNVEGDANALMGLVDDLTGRLLAARSEGSGTRLAGLAALTTDSLAALKAYLEGEREYRGGRYQRAAQAFQLAVAVDSLFALAHYRLAVAASWTGEQPVMDAAIANAVRHGARLARADRRLVDAQAALLTSRFQDAEALLRPHLEANPDDVEAWFHYGDVLLHFNAFRGRSAAEAIGPFDRALALDPDNSAYVDHRMEVAATIGDAGILDSLYRRLDPASDHAIVWRAARAFLGPQPAAQQRALDELRAGTDLALLQAAATVATYARPPAAERVIVLLTEPSRSEPVQGLGHMMLGHLALAQGRLQVADAHFTALAGVDPTGALGLRVLAATVPFFTTTEAKLKALQAELAGEASSASTRSGPAALDPLEPVVRLYLRGRLADRLEDARGRSAAATAIEQAARRPPDDAPVAVAGAFLAQSLRALGEWRAGRPDAALAALPAAPSPLPIRTLLRSPVLSHAHERFVRAELLRDRGRVEEALAWYGTLGEGGLYDLPYRPIAHLRLAEYHADQGHRRQAAFHYARFIAAWTGCDPPLRPILEQAEARLGTLTTAR
ncbi:MAG: tetratricopeptide repeat protein [Gemmatimonadota bacterium]